MSRMDDPDRGRRLARRYFAARRLARAWRRVPGITIPELGPDAARVVGRAVHRCLIRATADIQAYLLGHGEPITLRSRMRTITLRIDIDAGDMLLESVPHLRLLLPGEDSPCSV